MCDKPIISELAEPPDEQEDDGRGHLHDGDVLTTVTVAFVDWHCDDLYDPHADQMVSVTSERQGDS